MLFRSLLGEVDREIFHGPRVRRVTSCSYQEGLDGEKLV